MKDNNLDNTNILEKKSFLRKYSKIFISVFSLFIILLSSYFIIISNIDLLLNKYVLSKYNLVCGYNKSSSSIFLKQISFSDFYINKDEEKLFKADNLTLEYNILSIFSKKLKSLYINGYEIDIDNILNIINTKDEISLESIIEAQNNQDKDKKIENKKEHKIDNLEIVSIFQNVSLLNGSINYSIKDYKIIENDLNISINHDVDNNINISKTSNVQVESNNNFPFVFTTDINTSLNINSLDTFILNISIGLNNGENLQTITFQNYVYLNNVNIGDLINDFLDEASFQFSMIDNKSISLEGIITAGESADKCFQKVNVKSIDGALLCSRFQGSKIDKSFFNQFIPKDLIDYHFDENSVKYINGSGFISISSPKLSSYKISFETMGSPFYYQNNKILEKADLKLEYQKLIDKSPQLEIKLMDLVSENNSTLQSKGIIKNIFGSQDFDISIISDIKDFAGLKDIILNSNNLELLSYIPKRLSSNIYIKGGMSDIKSKDYKNIEIKGNLLLEDLLLNLNNVPPIYLDNANININTEKISLMNAKVSLSGSNYKVSGFIEDYLDYLFNKGSLKGEIKAASSYVNLNQLLKDIEDMKNKQAFSNTALSQQDNINNQKSNENNSSNKNIKTKSQNKSTDIEISNNINLVIKTNLKKIVHNNVTLENIKGKVTIKKGKISIDNVEAKAFRGTIKLGGNIDLYKDKNKHTADLNLKYKNINLQDINKKDITFLSSITGKVSGNAKFIADLDNHFLINKSSIKSSGKINFLNPEIDSKNILLKSVSLIKNNINNSNIENIKVNDFSIYWHYANNKTDIEPAVIVLNNNKIEIVGSFYDNQYLDYKTKVTLNKLPYVRVDIKGTKDKPTFYVNSDDAGKLIQSYVYQKSSEYLKKIF